MSIECRLVFAIIHFDHRMVFEQLINTFVQMNYFDFFSSLLLTGMADCDLACFLFALYGKNL